jgi:HEAT repeat protein
MGKRRVRKLAQERDVAGLLDVAADGSDFEEWLEANDALRDLGSSVADELLRILEEDEARRAVRAGSLLADLDDARAVDPLLRRMRALDLRSPSADAFDEWLRFAGSLVRLEPSRRPGADELLELLKHGQPEIARKAGVFLGDVGERRAVEPLLSRLRSIDLGSATDDELGVWRSAVGALRALEAPEAVDPLVAALPVLAGDFPRYWEAAEDAAEALEDIGDPRAVPALAALLDPEPPFWVGNAVWNALNEIGTPEAREAVVAWEARDATPPDSGEWVAFPVRGPSEGRLRWWSRRLRSWWARRTWRPRS